MDQRLPVSPLAHSRFAYMICVILTSFHCDDIGFSEDSADLTLQFLANNTRMADQRRSIH